jgi:glycosyltransferase Alg8
MHFSLASYSPPQTPSVVWGLQLLGYSALICIILLSLPDAARALASHKGLYALGVIGVWRYGWAAINFIRAAFYLCYKFPKIRRAAQQQATGAPLYVVVLSYKIPPAVFAACYKKLITEAFACGRTVTIVASVTNALEQQHIASLFAAHTHHKAVKLLLMQQSGLGKRTALAQALRAVSRTLPPPNAEVILMDGDTLVRPQTFRKIAGFFEQNPKLGAFTVDNQVLCKGIAVVRAWYDLRFMQRHILMSSQSLSNRVLVLTGRFSVFRASLALQPSFINALENDALEHWHYGRIPFVTGDDKSTWFWLLQRGYDMLYVPDVIVDCCETQRDKKFTTHSIPLMQRWFGNMLRNNGRALALTPKRMPFFLWWSLLDQRLSMWTALFAPTAALLLTAFISHHYAWLYIVWLLLTRLAYSLLIGSYRRRFSPFFPFLLVYNQVVGAWIKITMQFHLPKQGWRQLKVFSTPVLKRTASYSTSFALFTQTVAVLTFVYGVGVIVFQRNSILHHAIVW